MARDVRFDGNANGIGVERECPFENGMAERSVGLIKTSFRILNLKCPELPDERLLVRDAISRNMIPNLKSGMSPAQIMIGRSDALAMIESRNLVAEGETNDEMLRNQVHHKALMGARQAAVQADSEYIIRAGIQRPLRNGPQVPPKENYSVGVFQKLGKEPRPRWHHGYRTMAHSGRHGVVGRSNRVFKIPLFRLRIANSGSGTSSNNNNENDSITKSAGEIPLLQTTSRSPNDPPRSSSADESTADLIGVIHADIKSVKGGNVPPGSEAAEKFKHLAVTGLGDVLGEIYSQHIAAWGHSDSGCEWQCWGPRGKVDFATTLGAVTEQNALIGHDLNRIAPKGFLQVEAAR